MTDIKEIHEIIRKKELLDKGIANIAPLTAYETDVLKGIQNAFAIEHQKEKEREREKEKHLSDGMLNYLNSRK